MNMPNKITKKLLEIVSEYDNGFKGAFNIREDGKCAGRQSSENIRLESKTDKPGLDIIVKPGTKGETVSIPACVTKAGIDDLVYNDFFIGEGADVRIVAGCGIHADGEEGEARHNGIHRFMLEKNAHAVYVEKHIGTGATKANRFIARFKGLAFYLWAVALFMTLGQTIHFIIVKGEGNWHNILWLGVAALVFCALQFGLGKWIGHKYGDTIAGGQLLGQKNSAMGIWMANHYLDPLASVYLAFYSVLQNLFNSWQIWYFGRKTKRHETRD